MFLFFLVRARPADDTGDESIQSLNVLAQAMASPARARSALIDTEDLLIEVLHEKFAGLAPLLYAIQEYLLRIPWAHLQIPPSADQLASEGPVKGLSPLHALFALRHMILAFILKHKDDAWFTEQLNKESRPVFMGGFRRTPINSKRSAELAQLEDNNRQKKSRPSSSLPSAAHSESYIAQIYSRGWHSASAPKIKPQQRHAVGVQVLVTCLLLTAVVES